ncbi:MAG: alanine--glyoxylate aminotransferase family protein, partial [Acidobacteriota bacterium]
MSEEIRFFLPGPTYVADEVRHAMTRQPIGHRSAAFKELYGSVSRRLPDVFRTSEEVMTVTGSGSLCWDLAVASTMRGRVLCFTNGAFSERFLTVCRGHGVDVEQVEVPWGEPISPDLVRRHLRAGGPWAGVTLAHNETSTGVLSPLEQI